MAALKRKSKAASVGGLFHFGLPSLGNSRGPLWMICPNSPPGALTEKAAVLSERRPSPGFNTSEIKCLDPPRFNHSCGEERFPLHHM